MNDLTFEKKCDLVLFGICCAFVLFIVVSIRYGSSCGGPVKNFSVTTGPNMFVNYDGEDISYICTDSICCESWNETPIATFAMSSAMVSDFLSEQLELIGFQEHEVDDFIQKIQEYATEEDATEKEYISMSFYKTDLSGEYPETHIFISCLGKDELVESPEYENQVLGLDNLTDSTIVKLSAEYSYIP